MVRGGAGEPTGNEQHKTGQFDDPSTARMVYVCVIQRETCGKLRRRLGELVNPAQCERTRPDSNKIYEPCGYVR